jgi:hypothetical protein
MMSCIMLCGVPDQLAANVRSSDLPIRVRLIGSQPVALRGGRPCAASSGPRFGPKIRDHAAMLSAGITFEVGKSQTTVDS